MVCYYLRHIDLHAVYEQLPNYEPGHLRPSLANIPPPLCDTLALYFEQIAEVAAESSPLFPYWHQWDSSDLAAEVGGLIEIEIEHLGQDASCLAPTDEEVLTHGEMLGSFLSFINDALSILETESNYFPLLCLLVYQYDALCSLYASGHMEAALGVFESIAEARETLTHSHWLSRKERMKKLMRSDEARERAALRHAPSNQRREAVLREWKEYGREYKGHSDFARIIIRRDNLQLTERTVARWVSDYEATEA
jgi:hypothetical protein